MCVKVAEKSSRCERPCRRSLADATSRHLCCLRPNWPQLPGTRLELCGMAWLQILQSRARANRAISAAHPPPYHPRWQSLRKYKGKLHPSTASDGVCRMCRTCTCIHLGLHRCICKSILLSYSQSLKHLPLIILTKMPQPCDCDPIQRKPSGQASGMAESILMSQPVNPCSLQQA